MIKWLLKFLGISSESIDFKALINEGAIIIDVRSHQEFQSGHVRKSKNIPLNELNMKYKTCLLYTSPSPRDTERSRMPSSA